MIRIHLMDEFVNASTSSCARICELMPKGKPGIIARWCQ